MKQNLKAPVKQRTPKMPNENKALGIVHKFQFLQSNSRMAELARDFKALMQEYEAMGVYTTNMKAYAKTALLSMKIEKENHGVSPLRKLKAEQAQEDRQDAYDSLSDEIQEIHVQWMLQTEPGSSRG